MDVAVDDTVVREKKNRGGEVGRKVVNKDQKKKRNKNRALNDIGGNGTAFRQSIIDVATLGTIGKRRKCSVKG